MFDIGAPELLLIVVVAVIAIGPKDLPLALRTAGRWMAKMRQLSGHFRAGLDAMIREAEMEELERKWKEQNEKIMREHPDGFEEPERSGAYPPVSAPPAASAEAGAVESGPPAESGDLPADPPEKPAP